MLAVLVFGCTGTVEDSDTAPTESDSVEDTGVELPAEVLLTVTLDGLPVEGAVVTQGGVDGSQLTDVNGQVTVAVDRTIDGEVALMASHPDARIRAQSGREAEQTIALVSFDRADNEDYVFDRPGTPGGGTTAQCGHCHVTMVEAWQASPHRTSASNPRLHDVYAGIAANLDATECADAGGSWAPGLTAGSLQTENRCYLGTGVLPDLNPTCTTDCETDPVANGACADCHAPGIDGVIGGRNLLEATGTSHDSGVHCDVCHKVESVDLDAPAGVGGRLHIVRPTEMTVTGLDPLTFGPFHDVPNPRMGAVQRDHFTSPELCAGCHQLKQEVLVPGESIDLTRWPDGVLPIHTTYDEFGTSSAACQDCHMPIDTTVGNSSDLGNLFDLVPGISAGWYRDDTVHEHAFFGPRQPDSGFLESAAGLAVTKTVDNGSLTAEVTVSSTRPPHAFPTGEPMRHLVLLVEARCGSEVLTATGGDVVPDYGGAIERKVGGDFSRWTDAQVGDVVRVVARLGGFVDYTGFGPFGDGRFAAGEKGLPIEQYVGEATVTSVDTGVASFDRALPQGEVAYLVRAQGLPTEGAAASGWAGAPGWAFARVLADADGNRMVPHHRAVDVVSDNRILAFQSWTSSHDFAATCADPEVEAVLLYRPYPYALSSERAWGMSERIAAQGVW
ncbi:MAG: hypothetical protein KC912_16170 [Proteobacteria bacterium]|nr:hypothetical protein [Pseudomonadota bacterium]